MGDTKKGKSRKKKIIIITISSLVGAFVLILTLVSLAALNPTEVL
jgi:hypothetical protein